MSANKTTLSPIRCTIEEKMMIEQQAEAMHLSVSAYVREMALGGGRPDDRFDVAFVGELKHIGADLHRVLGSTKGESDDRAELSGLCSKLDRVLDIIIETLHLS